MRITSIVAFTALYIMTLAVEAKIKTPGVFKNRLTTLNNHLKSYQHYNKSLKIDLPVKLNPLTKKWLKYYQKKGRPWFTRSLERSFIYLPAMKQAFLKKGLPEDLAYVALIESGFHAHATSHAQAVGYWQFIKGTSKRYGLKTSWWLDERRDYRKSTFAAANYLWDLYNFFDSWPLALAAYNCGEGFVKRSLKRHKVSTFWELVKKNALPLETQNYVPKITAAIIIAKAPKLYGFRNLKPKSPKNYETIKVPGGTNLKHLAHYLKTSHHKLQQLNPSLLKGYIPSFVSSYEIRIPKGYQKQTSQYFVQRAKSNVN